MRVGSLESRPTFLNSDRLRKLVDGEIDFLIWKMVTIEERRKYRTTSARLKANAVPQTKNRMDAAGWSEMHRVNCNRNAYHTYRHMS
jgi:hypothetical protein